jgi:hypothetical protein
MADANTIDVLSLNVWGLPWPLALDRARRFERIARHFRDSTYHLVGIQEAWWPHGGALRIPGLRLAGGRRDSGLGLAGSLAGEGPHEVLSFDAARGSDRLVAKGLMVGRVTVGDAAVIVGVTHLQAHAGEQAIRARQVDQIVERLAGEREPVVLMGDFNFHGADDRGSEDALGRAGFHDTGAEADAPTWLPRNPFTRSQGRFRFDRIFVRDGDARRWRTHAVRVLSRLWSDHQPLHASLELVAG